jgi:hypothetical protein
LETLTLTTPISNTGYHVVLLALNWAKSSIRVVVQDSDGMRTIHSYSGSAATTLMDFLNKADLSANSLHKRVLDRLVSDAKLPAGTVTGSPD